MVEQGFHDFINALEPRYTIVSRKHLQQTLLPNCHIKVEEAIKSALMEIDTCSLTLDIWSSRRMHAYLGITCHFVTKEWEVLSLLIACSQLHGRHTGENILSEFEEVVSRAGISPKVYRVVTDNASNISKVSQGLTLKRIQMMRMIKWKYQKTMMLMSCSLMRFLRGCLVLLIHYSSPSTMD